MEAISELRERILELYSKYETYITPVVRFLIALVSILMINSGLGYMDRLTNIIIVIVVSLIAAFLPLNFTIVIDALFILLHLYSLSITVAAIVFFVFLIMFVLYLVIPKICNANNDLNSSKHKLDNIVVTKHNNKKNIRKKNIVKKNKE